MKLKLAIALALGVLLGVSATLALQRQREQSYAFDFALIGTWQAVDDAKCQVIIGYEKYFVVRDGLPVGLTGACGVERGKLVITRYDEEGDLYTYNSGYRLSDKNRHLFIESPKMFNSQKFERVGSALVD